MNEMRATQTRPQANPQTRPQGKTQKVSIIPATKRVVQAGGQIKSVHQLRVAAYCRVSTGDESQQTSYTKQKAYYTELINRKDGWTMAGIFADEGISGTSTKRRTEFQRMMEEAMAGKIDYIVTKSISRFARNTVDTLSCVRQLQEQDPPVGIYFEKENIDTLDAKGELILTILSALAQDESRSISDNIKWTIQKNFRSGKAHVNPNRIYGFRKGSNGEWEIQPEQAEVVRYIFKSYLAGRSATMIAEELNAQGHKTGLDKLWRADSILYVLRNEKYVGDCEMQKTVTESYLTHRNVTNEGQAPRIYFTDHHVPIIDRDTWDKTRAMMTLQNTNLKRKRGVPKKSKKGKGPRFAAFGNLTCGDCGAAIVKRTYSTPLHDYSDARSAGFDPETETELYYMRYGVWRCENATRNGREPDDPPCENGSIMELTLQQSFMEMLYRIKRDYDARGEDSDLMRLFRERIEREKQMNKEYLYAQVRIEAQKDEITRLVKERDDLDARRLEAMQLAVKEQEQEMVWTFDMDDDVDVSEFFRDEGDGDIEDEAGVYAALVAEIDQRIEAAKKALEELEQGEGVVYTLENNFRIFLNCLEGLPETNPAGMKLNINTIDTQGSLLRTLDGKPIIGKRSNLNRGKITITPEKIAEAPDLLVFDKRIYMAFFESGVVDGDRILLKTIFGVDMVMEHIRRPLTGFLGFRRCKEDGSVEYLSNRYQITERKIGYTRKKKDGTVAAEVDVDEDELAEEA